MRQPIRVVLEYIDGARAMCRDEHGHEFFIPTDLLPSQTQGDVICLKIMPEHEAVAEHEFRAKEILKAILAERIS